MGRQFFTSEKSYVLIICRRSGSWLSSLDAITIWVFSSSSAEEFNLGGRGSREELGNNKFGESLCYLTALTHSTVTPLSLIIFITLYFLQTCLCRLHMFGVASSVSHYLKYSICCTFIFALIGNRMENCIVWLRDLDTQKIAAKGFQSFEMMCGWRMEKIHLYFKLKNRYIKMFPLIGADTLTVANEL